MPMISFAVFGIKNGTPCSFSRAAVSIIILKANPATGPGLVLEQFVFFIFAKRDDDELLQDFSKKEGSTISIFAEVVAQFFELSAKSFLQMLC